MSKKNQRLDHLFKRMQQEYPSYNNNFKKDGINDENLFIIQKSNGKAVLFIAKEPNNKGKQEIGDFRDWWKDEPLQFSFSLRLAEWAYGIVNEFPKYSEAEKDKNRYDGLMSVSFMNLKKSGGTGTAIHDPIYTVVKDTKGWILEEINIIEPDIIIGCGLYNSVWKEIFEIKDWTKSGYDINITRWGNIKIIDYYHPSNRFPKAMNYVLLEKIIKSDSFAEL